MITCLLAGRLGNYMHQVATTYAYSLRHGIDYAIPPNELNYGALFPNVHTIEGIDTLGMHKHNEPRTQEYAPIPKRKEILIEGYFQSEKYYSDFANEVADLFKLPYTMNKGVVSIHVRRGDYVQHSNVFPPVGSAYLKKAVAAFTESGYTHFKVFSDDIGWCKEHFNYYSGATFEYSNGTKGDIYQDYQDMIDMSCCEHNIIANSTFSWWAAWLNRSPDKIVVCPSAFNWFGKHSPLNTKDYIPEGWVQIVY